MKKIFLSLLLLHSFVFAGTVNVAVAANVSYAMDSLLKSFHKKHPNIQVQVSLGSSGKLTAQIKNHAPYDVFMSANMAYPSALYKEGLTLGKPLIYAQGSLVLFSLKKRDFSQGIKLLKSSKIKRIAMANPKTAPYGKATQEFLDNTKLYNSIKSKLIFGESIGQTISYSVSAADMGFIAASALHSPKMKRFKKGVNYIDLDNTLYTPISQGVVLLKNTIQNKDAELFYKFILSTQAKEIFRHYGYNVK